MFFLPCGWETWRRAGPLTLSTSDKHAWGLSLCTSFWCWSLMKGDSQEDCGSSDSLSAMVLSISCWFCGIYKLAKETQSTFASWIAPRAHSSCMVWIRCPDHNPSPAVHIHAGGQSWYLGALPQHGSVCDPLCNTLSWSTGRDVYYCHTAHSKKTIASLQTRSCWQLSKRCRHLWHDC